MNFSEAEKEVTRVVQELAAIRKAAGMSQYRLGEITGLSREAIRLIESGKRSPALQTLLIMCSALDIELARLLDGDGGKPSR